MSKPKKIPSSSAAIEAWVAQAAQPWVRCRICNEEGKAEWLRVAVEAMARTGVRVSRRKIAAEMYRVFGGTRLQEGTVMSHLEHHEPAWKGVPSAGKK